MADPVTAAALITAAPQVLGLAAGAIGGSQNSAATREMQGVQGEAMRAQNERLLAGPSAAPPGMSAGPTNYNYNPYEQGPQFEDGPQPGVEYVEGFQEAPVEFAPGPTIDTSQPLPPREETQGPTEPGLGESLVGNLIGFLARGLGPGNPLSWVGQHYAPDVANYIFGGSSGGQPQPQEPQMMTQQAYGQAPPPPNVYGVPVWFDDGRRA